MANNWDMGGNDLIVNTVSVGATGPGQAGTNLSGAELTVLDGVTAGTITASKAVVVDSGSKITSGLKSLTFDAGTATVAPVVLTSGTNLTTAAAGAVEFDGTAFYATAVNSSRQQLDAEQYIQQNADFNQSTNGGNAVTKVFNTSTNGAVTLAAGKTYMFEAQYWIADTSTTAHTWQTLFGGTATLTSLVYFAYGNNLATASIVNAAGTGGTTSIVNQATATVVTPSVSAAGSASIQLFGTVVINAGGTFIPQVQASASLAGGTTQTTKAGSFFRIWEMANNTTVGNWS